MVINWYGDWWCSGICMGYYVGAVSTKINKLVDAKMNKQIEELMSRAYVDAGTLFAEMLCNDSEVSVKIAEAWNEQPAEVRSRIFDKIHQNQIRFANMIIEKCADTARQCYTVRAVDAEDVAQHIEKTLL